MSRRVSGLQREVLQLYRQCIRAAHTKPKDNQPRFLKYIRSEFGQYKDLPRKEFSTIEHLLRVGHKRLEMYSAPELKDIH
ncbi:LAFE_0F03752g1_1 [Lachancea fermentati]|uniref:LAFE_0F03752g1_1 n=1 Tax=Lachancea fermentati TaxID=4955 RepID=A0A1G4MEN0_LACFM|nr:LAFE_0F03752g1_1 [Lachancea fermentati]